PARVEGLASGLRFGSSEGVGFGLLLGRTCNGGPELGLLGLELVYQLSRTRFGRILNRIGSVCNGMASFGMLDDGLGSVGNGIGSMRENRGWGCRQGQARTMGLSVLQALIGV
ncbi:hypothetical protein V6N11_034197, partial [Hibiscus sabdariffa]